MVLWSSAASVAYGQSTELVLLGTGGGQRIFEHRSQTSQALVRGDSIIVIDTGFNAARQIAWAGLDAGSIDMIFITHDHRDHTQHIGRVLHAAWTAGRTDPVHIYSYPGIGDVIDAELAKIENVDAAQVRGLAVLHELTEPGVIYRDDAIQVTSVENTHGMDYSYAFRFDMPDRSVVFSGDTGYDERVVELAGGADVLVHEAVYMPLIEETVIAARDDPETRQQMRQHLTTNHISTELAGQVATEAAVGMLVISHIVPVEMTANDDHLLLDILERHYDGPIVIGRDLMWL
ncbi:MAG: MBL fold metallo-hydrolase [Rhodospirillaceae bacterium]|nr:MBL fold metallo-hydrolase [Rhodospirillaceae bacterium]